jgi:hypothetical protein
MATPLAKMDKQELIDLADEIGGVEDLDMSMTQKVMLAKLAEAGYTEEAHQAKHAPKNVVTTADAAPLPEQQENTVVTVEDEAKVVSQLKPAEKILLKMTRENFSYEVRGYRFTREHPFVAVNAEDADYLIENEEGFRPASPKEAREFYS